MAKGKRKGRQRKQDIENVRRHDVSISATQALKNNENEITVVNNVEAISVSSPAGADNKVSTSRESSKITPASTSAAETAVNPQRADSINDKRAEDYFYSKGQFSDGLPSKQKPGKLGRQIKLISNLYPIGLLPDRNVYHYDVKITKCQVSQPSNLSNIKDKNYRGTNTRLNREVIQIMLDNDILFRKLYAVFDGKYNLYTPSPLQYEFPYETTVFLENENKNLKQKRSFLIQINPVKKKNTHGMKENNCAINLAILHELYRGEMPVVDDIQEALLALETIFRHSPSLRYVPIGRNFYHPNIGGMHPLSEGIQIWFGYHQSLRLGQWKLMVNLNTSATTFFKRQTLIEYVAQSLNISLRELLNFQNMEFSMIEKLADELRNVRIETYHQGFKVKRSIIDLSKESASRLEFEVDFVSDKAAASCATRTITISQYFHEKYNINLKYPHLPCVQVKPKDRKIYLPLEVCNIPEGVHCKKELSIEDKRTMIEKTADPPMKKFNKITDIRNERSKYNEDECLNSFGIKVDSNPASVDGRIICSPNLLFNKAKTIQPKAGSWNIKDVEFYEGAKISSWVILSLAPKHCCDFHDLEHFSLQLQRIGKAAGLNMDKCNAIKILPVCNNYEKMRKASEELKYIKKESVQLTIVVIPNKDKFLYNNIKQVAEVELGLLTQCIVNSNAKKCNLSVLSNLCVKINAKMGGTNHTLMPRELPLIMTKPVIIIGADVCHPGTTDKTGISVASVVGGLDMTLSRFAVVNRLQKNLNSKKKSVEIILDLKNMVINLLKTFYRYTKARKPEKILFYRDGVSDGQFYEVQQKEVKAIRDACMEIQKDGEYQPAITFVTVQKRHQVRLRPADSRDERNIQPGTVVDTEIVHPLYRDFYLCSHQGLKGTSRPAHYTVLEDDNEFPMDDLQKLTNFSCYISFRCCKSISIPVPVHYADAAAYRTRLRISTLPEDLIKKQMKSEVILQEMRDKTETAALIKDAMYFV